MRIDAYAQVQQLYSTGKAQKVKKEAKTGFRDELQISSRGKDFQLAKGAVMALSDVREDVVIPLKSSIDAGNYEVSAESFAAKVIDKYNQMQFNNL